MAENPFTKVSAIRKLYEKFLKEKRGVVTEGN
jgi:hypothetical protein